MVDDESYMNESISPILDSTESIISNGSPTEVESSSFAISTKESSSNDQFYMASQSSIDDTSISDYLSSHLSNKDTSISDYLSSHPSNKDTSISDDLLSQSSNKDTSISDDLLSQSSSNEYTSQDESFEKVSFINENRATSSCINTVSIEKKKQEIGNYHETVKHLKQNIAEDYTESNYKLQIEYLRCFNKKGIFYYTSTSKLSFKTIKETISNIDKTSLIFIKGPSGCGKSTNVPFYIYTSCLKKNINCNIIITQPTSIAAITIAKKLCKKINCCLGTYVGYHTDFVKSISTDTFITYCTNYILLRKFVKRNVNSYTHIILDDVHVRSKELDILLFFKKSLTYNKNINYLNERSLLGSSKLIQRMMIYCGNLIKAIEDSELKKNKGKILNKKNGILIFLPKIQEIEQMYDILTSDEYKYQWDIIIFDSSINIYKQEKLLNPELPYKNRRIILATNIAENGIKIPDIKYVIDFCLTAQLEINQKSKIPQLRNIWASKVICEQRSNRISCNGKGYVYRLVTKQFYTELLYKELNPEIMECPLEDMFIQMKIYQHSYESNNIFSSLIDPPPLKNVELSQLLLQECGALCNNINEDNINITQLTDLGHLMGALPLEIHLTKLILLGYFYGLTEDMIIIACCMSVKDIFFALYDKKQALNIYSEKLHWANGSDSDCIALLNVYKEWIKIQNMSIDFQQKWAKINFLQIDALNEVSMRITIVKNKLRQFHIDEMNSCNAIKWNINMVEEVIMKIIIAGAFYPNYYNKCTHLESSYRKHHLTRYFNAKNTIILENFPVQEPKFFYMRQTDKIFKRYLNSHFETIISSSSLSSQIYIHFKNEEDREIPLNVYKSIQMRKLKIPFEISCLNEKYPNHDNIFEENYIDTLSHYYIKNSNIFKDEYAYMNPMLPSITVSTFPIDKIDYISPYYFLVQMKDSQINMTKEMIMKSLNEDSNSLTTFNILPNVNDLVAVPLEIKDDIVLYYRGIVKKYEEMMDETYVTLQLIDIGFPSVKVLCNLMRKIKNPYIYKIPALILECVLAGIQDNPNKNDQDTSSMDFIREFVNMNDTNENQLHGEIYSIVNNVVAITLLLKTEEKTYNINELLLDKNYAIVKEESQLSKENNYVRNNYLHMSEQAIESYNKMQYRDECSNDSCAFVKLDSDVKEFNSMNKITLTGPYSLLECNLSALIKGGKLKRAIIDSNSINSVILDNDTNKRKQNKDFFLIAGKVMRNVNDNTLMLYNSTVIESTCGLQALITLLFSSHLELRYDLSGTCCIGALCGLGFDKYTGYSIFPEHDMAIPFNYEISLKDIKLINDIRKYMNKMTHYSKDIDHETIMRRRIMYQYMIQILILKLLKNDRKENKHIFPLNYDKWRLYEEKSKMINRNYQYNVSFNDKIYESHSLNGLNYFK
ncbi:PREDICTED: putative ATP-dependent RNA helicase TDRD9 [Polistes dominula]|uniref:ATP-dependent RNA helicase TDRD9 n=1 Tax=Polistes dominula TaxID=743375 RepID=A0ABM1ICG5_POLDO|nr:PREDICTED: putative ATP-dependent RNA helicase TDRD9 [Polistes dominula]